MEGCIDKPVPLNGATSIRMSILLVLVTSKELFLATTSFFPRDIWVNFLQLLVLHPQVVWQDNYFENILASIDEKVSLRPRLKRIFLCFGALPSFNIKPTPSRLAVPRWSIPIPRLSDENIDLAIFFSLF